MSSPAHTDKKRKNILIFGKGPTQGSDDTQHITNVSRSNTKFCLSLHYNGSSSFYLLMLQKYINSKQKTCCVQKIFHENFQLIT